MKLRSQGGVVFIDDADDAMMYFGSHDEFAAEHGAPVPDLPAGMAAFAYDADAKIMVYFDKKQNAFPVAGAQEEPVCDAAAANVDALKVMMVAREKAKEEAAHAAFRQAAAAADQAAEQAAAAAAPERAS